MALIKFVSPLTNKPGGENMSAVEERAFFAGIWIYKKASSKSARKDHINANLV